MPDKTGRHKALCDELNALYIRKNMVEGEPIRDPLIDLANYAIMTILELEE